ncbi:putative Sulfate adenylyltransferase [Magnetospirillum sp. XM-1]|uniref:hypothetical protein n=1 Tax=Magnetospirillum sp. XM-1 TaxID=1663591 RepID=UPI00073E09FD|nr:hypothetical protein [Magnetospirillum sp. XM-1]CUW38000.1 putative Sulfate adenylyltransferase [Magnetospirillum sp. XM-1]
MRALSSPYGGTLVDRLVPPDEFSARLGRVVAHVALSHDALINLCNIAVGCYSPLTGFMTEAELNGVLGQSRLPGGPAWTIPILLHVGADSVKDVAPGGHIALVTAENKPLAVMEVSSVFTPDANAYCRSTFATTDAEHPGVAGFRLKPKVCLGGPVFVDGAALPRFLHQRFPAETRDMLAAAGVRTATAFSTRNISHIGHEYLHTIALETTDILGINVITGAQVKGSFVPEIVFDAYEHMIATYFPENRAFLANMRLPPIYAGPREAFLQATVAQNQGFTHFIVGRDHAGIGSYYPRYGSQQIFEEITDLDIRIMAISEPRWCKVCGKITTERSCRHSGRDIRLLNGRDVRRFLLEKRFGELDGIIRTELRDHLVKLVEAHRAGATLAEPRQVFYE